MDVIRCSKCGEPLAKGSLTIDKRFVKDVRLLCSSCAVSKIDEFYTLDICWYTCSESEWMAQGEFYDTKEDALDVACELLSEGYCVKLVKHGGEIDEV